MRGWILRLVWSTLPFLLCLGFCTCRKAVLTLTRAVDFSAFNIPLTAVVAITHNSGAYVLFPFPSLLESYPQCVPGSSVVAVWNCIQCFLVWSARPSACVLHAVVKGAAAQLRARQGGIPALCVKRRRQKKRDLYRCENGLNCYSAALVYECHTREGAGLHWVRFTPVHRKSTYCFCCILWQKKKKGSRKREATQLSALERGKGKKSSTGLYICLWETSRALFFEMAGVWWYSFFVMETIIYATLRPQCSFHSLTQQH